MRAHRRSTCHQRSAGTSGSCSSWRPPAQHSPQADQHTWVAEQLELAHQHVKPLRICNAVTPTPDNTTIAHSGVFMLHFQVIICIEG